MNLQEPGVTQNTLSLRGRRPINCVRVIGVLFIQNGYNKSSKGSNLTTVHECLKSQVYILLAHYNGVFVVTYLVTYQEQT